MATVYEHRVDSTTADRYALFGSDSNTRVYRSAVWLNCLRNNSSSFENENRKLESNIRCSAIRVRGRHAELMLRTRRRKYWAYNIVQRWTLYVKMSFGEMMNIEVTKRIVFSNPIMTRNYLNGCPDLYSYDVPYGYAAGNAQGCHIRAADCVPF